MQQKRQGFNFLLRENRKEFLYFYRFNNITRKSLKDTMSDKFCNFQFLLILDVQSGKCCKKS